MDGNIGDNIKIIDNIKNRIIDNNLYDTYINNFNNGYLDTVKIYKIYICYTENKIKEYKIYWFDVYKEDIESIYKDKNKINNLWNKLLYNALITCGSVYSKDELFYNYNEYIEYIRNNVYQGNEELKKEIIKEFD